jgi:hypothetical protein
VVVVRRFVFGVESDGGEAMKRLTCFAAVIAFTIAVPSSVWALPDIAVTPLSHDFGELEVGAAGTASIVIGNPSGFYLVVSSIAFRDGSSSDFFISNVDVSNSGWDQSPDDRPLLIGPINGTVHTIVVEITYIPSDLGVAEAELEIISNDPDNPKVLVDLRGTGVGSQALDIEAILKFFDDGVEAGTIQGKGPGCAKDAHLKVFRFKLLMAAFFIDKGWNKGACKLLWQAYARSDGQGNPRDLVQGQDVPELNAMILQLLSDMGCL